MSLVWKIRRLKDGLYKGKGANNWDWSAVGHPFMTVQAAKSNASHSYPGIDDCELVTFELKEISCQPITFKGKK